MEDENMSTALSEPLSIISQRRSPTDYQQILRRTQPVLRIYLECQYGLLPQIVTLNILTEEQRKNVIGRKRNRFKQNDRLLKELRKQMELDPYDNFLVALKNTNQEHLAKYIIHNGDVVSLGDDRPLTKKERLKLNSLRQYFIDQICLKELLALLFSKYCISERQVSGINQHGCKEDQIYELCEILERRSYAQYKIFVDCCKETHQDHIAGVIIETGVVMMADVVVERSSCAIQNYKIEKEVVQRYNAVINKKTNDVENDCLRVPDTKLLGLQTQHSIRLYIQCSTVDAFKALCRLSDSGQLKSNIEQFFNKLCDRCDFAPVTLSELYLINRDSCKMYFNIGSSALGVSEEKRRQRQLPQSSELSELRALQRYRYRGMARGIAQLGTELLVCTDCSVLVAVYDLKSYSQTRHVTIPGMRVPGGLTVCKHNSCLNISDHRSKSIHRVDLSKSLGSQWPLNAAPRGDRASGEWRVASHCSEWRMMRKVLMRVTKRMKKRVMK